MSSSKNNSRFWFEVDNVAPDRWEIAIIESNKLWLDENVALMPIAIWSKSKMMMMKILWRPTHGEGKYNDHKNQRCAILIFIAVEHARTNMNLFGREARIYCSGIDRCSNEQMNNLD